ncbi:MAG: aminodeoxychorismate/anthranilate synthase component II [Candidatus Eremiobacteraeota bacterium]|nr:aminodeoxychorismate/anthranilate synthase component II [Candidatus Eremiobacteraeota bacterium]
MNILFVDNFDSFTYNVVHLFAAAGAHVEVMLNDDVRLVPSVLDRYDALLIGPGPGNPSQAPSALRMLDAAAKVAKPVFGVCLGMQAIAEFFGGKIVHAPHLMHGKTSRIGHDGTGVFAGLPENFTATRYHSLCVDPASVPATLQVTATSDDGVIQGLSHRTLPIHGVQFHPESILSEYGKEIASNFLALTLTPAVRA